MSDAEIQSMKADIEQLRREVEALRYSLNNMTIAPESGGGRVLMRGDIPVIRIDSLTPSGVQIAG